MRLSDSGITVYKKALPAAINTALGKMIGMKLIYNRVIIDEDGIAQVVEYAIYEKRR